jgi:hypothetical protein
MEVVHPRCAGMDVSKKDAKVCVRVAGAGRRKRQVAEVLPLLYLHGLSSSDFGPALGQFLGSGAGLSPSTITRLTAQWQDEAKAFNKRSLWPIPTTCTAGSTASTSRSASSRTRCACW